MYKAGGLAEMSRSLILLRKQGFYEMKNEAVMNGCCISRRDISGPSNTAPLR